MISLRWATVPGFVPASYEVILIVRCLHLGSYLLYPHSLSFSGLITPTNLQMLHYQISLVILSFSLMLLGLVDVVLSLTLQFRWMALGKNCLLLDSFQET